MDPLITLTDARTIPWHRLAFERFLYLVNPLRSCNSFPAAIRDTDLWERFWKAADPLRHAYWHLKNIRHRNGSIVLSDRARTMIEALRADGIAIWPGFVAADQIERLRQSAKAYTKLRCGFDVDAPKPGTQVQINRLANDLAPEHPILDFLRSPELFDIAGAYLGFAPRLRRVTLMYNQPLPDLSGTENVAKHFHTDTHDFRVLKFFVYLTDTGSKNGPFTYVRGTHFLGPKRGVVCRMPSYSTISSKEMNVFVPSSAWVEATGPAGTAFFAETSGVHRGGRTEEGHRFMLVAEYAGYHPWHRFSHDVEDPNKIRPKPPA